MHRSVAERAAVKSTRTYRGLRRERAEEARILPKNRSCPKFGRPLLLAPRAHLKFAVDPNRQGEFRVRNVVWRDALTSA